MNTIRFLFGMGARVQRGQYLCWGIGLFVVKYLGEVIFYYIAQRSLLNPLSFLSPVLSLRYPGFSSLPDWFGPLVMLWSLPFIWIGTGMSIRRAADAGFSPWSGIMFFVPILNYMLMIVLSFVPTAQTGHWSAQEVRDRGERLMPPLAMSVALAVCGTFLTWFSTNFLKVYATSLFVGSPLILGLLQGYLLNFRSKQPLGRTIGTTVLTIFLIHLLLLLFALEGLICLAMSFPLSATLAAIGAALGSAIAIHGKSSAISPSLLVLALPLLPIGEAMVIQPHRDFVLSVVEIDAAPERVWPNVVKFSDLPPATEWLFRLGVAHPVRARIDGSGVGAVRRCEFSTGAFVEPITVWDEPHRLAFDVREQPQPMKELSFYEQVDAPHLNGYFRSVRGEFRLVPTANGRTRLEGRTWYESNIQPGWYWQIYGRWFIHKIHLRVLAHIKNLSEDGERL